MSLFCKKCGHRIEDGTCTWCGREFKNNPRLKKEELNVKEEEVVKSIKEEEEENKAIE